MIAMFTTTTVTDIATAFTAIREAAIPSDAEPWEGSVSISFDSTVTHRQEVVISGLCRDTYPTTGQLLSDLRVTHGEKCAYMHATLDPARDWCEQIVAIVDWLATESPVPA